MYCEGWHASWAWLCHLERPGSTSGIGGAHRLVGHEGMTLGTMSLAFFPLALCPPTPTSQPPWAKQLRFTMPFYHDVFVLGPTYHGMKPLKICVKWNVFSFKLWLAGTISQWWKSCWITLNMWEKKVFQMASGTQHGINSGIRDEFSL